MNFFLTFANIRADSTKYSVDLSNWILLPLLLIQVILKFFMSSKGVLKLCHQLQLVYI